MSENAGIAHVMAVLMGKLMINYGLRVLDSETLP
jgi:hypothetical protein